MMGNDGISFFLYEFLMLFLFGNDFDKRSYNDKIVTILSRAIPAGTERKETTNKMVNSKLTYLNPNQGKQIMLGLKTEENSPSTFIAVRNGR